ncbi:probable carboxylesterase 15 [Amaranthus tricolor]|uniref:probable carboxylesterase 15 n=1 Tax=Amaranthus tricolor TaxID=29722 RepID=UPI00258BD9AD|nr:probable carboxylesterase 15 [Amaranthus tricolor]
MGSLGELVEDCFGVVRLYSDGSVYRANECDIDFGHYNYNMNTEEMVEKGCLVEWEDCIFDEQHQLYLRVFKPCFNNKNITKNNKLPVVYYIHGGGFCLGSRTWPNCHNYCLRLASQLQALVIAPDYRLAPEHRLPAAIEDGINAVKWLQSQAKLKQIVNINNHYSNHQNPSKLLLQDNAVDFEKVYIIGDSSGGNIAHHLAVCFGYGSPDLSPIRICGYVLLGPFFGGSLRTKSEAEGPPEPILTLDSLDRFWRLSLPKGEDRDHPIANPFGPYSPNLERVSLDRMLIIVGEKEILKDRVKEYAKNMKGLGKDITYIEFEGQYHGFYAHNPCSNASNQLSQLIKQFMSC